MRTRCKCCNLPIGLKNALNSSLFDGVPYTSIISQINPLLPNEQKLTKNNLTTHKRHTIENYKNPETGLSPAESVFIRDFAATVRTLTERQAQIVAEYQNPESKRAWQHISTAVDTLKKLWSISKETLIQTSQLTHSEEEEYKHVA